MIKFINSFRFAFRGMLTHFLHGGNILIHLMATGIVIILGFLLHVSTNEWCLLLICIGLVLSAEAFNTVIEKFADYVKPGFHTEIGKIKDISASGVLIMAIISTIVAAIIFIPKI